MFCPKCGYEASGASRFCSACGANLAETKSYNSPGGDSAAVLRLKPRFLLIPTLLKTLPFQLFFTAWGGGFFGGFSQILLQMLRKKGIIFPQWYPFVFFALAFFFGIPIAIVYFKSKRYANTEYIFYKIKAEVIKGFGMTNIVQVDYKNIPEVGFTQGVFQRRFGMGSIFLANAAGLGLSQIAQSASIPGVFARGTLAAAAKQGAGILVADIEEAESNYTKIKGLISRAKSTQ